MTRSPRRCARPAVAERIGHGELPVLRTLTFMGNPLACAGGERLPGRAARRPGGPSGYPRRLARRGGQDRGGACGQAWRVPARYRGWTDARVLGAIGVLQLDHEADVTAATAAAAAAGVWLRPFRDLIYTMPPYVIAEDDLARVTGAMVAAAAAGG